MGTLPLTPDELLSTTRAVRKRLDLTRPVPRDVLEECLVLAQQAPSGSNSQQWHFLLVTDSVKRSALAEIYRVGWRRYVAESLPPAGADPARLAAWQRVRESAQYLADHLQDVPVLVLPCMRGRPDGEPTESQAGMWGSIIPAAWSFMLAARARGLGTAWTTLHLQGEKAATEVLGIPYAEVTQVALIPVAYTIGTAFKPGPRKSLHTMVHWDRW